MQLTAIQCAVEAEAAPLLGRMTDREETGRCSLRFVRGRINGHDCVVVRSGMGKVNAAAAAQCVIDTFSPARLIVSGVGGSLCRELRLFDLTLCEKTTHHDLPMAAVRADYPKMDSDWFVPDAALAAACRRARPEIKGGVYLTGEAFIDNEGRASLSERFGAEGLISADMETAAVAQVCRAAGVPFCCVRAISDTVEERGFDAFLKNVAEASVIAAAAVADMLEYI